MPNIKSAIKRVNTSEKQRLENTDVKSSMRTAIKNFNAKIEAGDVEGAKEALVLANKRIDKAASKGIIQRNKAAREKSRLSKQLNGLAS